ncbi:DUF4440 domain-containing protein [Porphyrobacter sp. AAP82]|uniref:DUF4440 domain-containing protein n=1 Tax=Porphyrobacter sp. AAP82 TaxID=1248917 RepID=UPI00031E0E0A|nr:DUF4440 domain-containing protein [Porphyrobacter sp. AAP82]
MKALFTAAAAFLAATPLAAEGPTPEEAGVIAAADAFFAALRSEDRTALAQQMLPEGMIFVHSRMTPEPPRIDAIPVADHLARWAKGTRKVDEVMRYDTVRVDGDMALVWGPYRFISDGQTSHCGINALSLVKTEGGAWKVANTSFTMERAERCAALGAPKEPR